MAESNGSSGGIGFFGLLTILFIGLKLTEHVSWSWWWVLSPILIPVGVVCSLFAVGGLGYGIATWLENKEK